MVEKTLVILMGNARGGEETWHTMYSNLLEPFNADLALCFGTTKDYTSYLYEKAKYIWECNEYEDWNNYYKQNCKGSWHKVLTGIGLGGDSTGYNGSVAIIFALRHFIKSNFKRILLGYDRIILTRSDFYYIDKHPITPNDSFYIVEGEDYDGIGDRHHIFKSDMVDDVLGIVDSMDNPNMSNFWLQQGHLNAEKALLLFFTNNGLINKLKRSRRVQFTVAVDKDSSRWQQAGNFIPGSDTIKHKYVSEYNLAFANKQLNYE